MKTTYEPYFGELLQQYRQNYVQCPLLTKCNEFSGINCADRDYIECLFFQDVLRNQLVVLRRKNHYLFEWRRIHSAIWYTINNENVLPKTRNPIERRAYANLINQVLTGNTIYAFGEFNCENKQLTITPTTETS